LTGVRRVLYDANSMGHNSKASVMEEPAVETGAPNGTGAKAAREVERKPAEPKSADAPPPGPPRSVWREYFESLVVTAVMALFGMTFVVQAVKVPTGSMQNTILIGDHLLVNKFIFAPGPHVPFLPQRDIRRGDIIVFKYPGKFQGEARFRDNPFVDDTAPSNIPYKTNYVKRVVGLPGDHIKIKGTDVYINNELLKEQKVAALNPPSDGDGNPWNGDENGAPLRDERGAFLTNEHAPVRAKEFPYIVYWNPGTLSGARNLAEAEEFVVPQEHYFAMGDNRDNSLDSRFWGFVPREAIIGRAMFVYWSYDESAPHSTAPIPFNIIVDFISNTRWRRTGTMVK
jgi:signal peptidase I